MRHRPQPRAISPFTAGHRLRLCRTRRALPSLPMPQPCRRSRRSRSAATNTRSAPRRWSSRFPAWSAAMARYCAAPASATGRDSALPGCRCGSGESGRPSPSCFRVGSTSFSSVATSSPHCRARPNSPHSGGRSMYVAVKGGEKAIGAAHRLLAETRRGDPAIPEVSLAQIEQQLALSVDRVMAEGSVYDRELAALAIKQARGDLIEAIFLLRAYRTTLPRLAVSEPVDTATMAIDRRISATFKDLPGGQVLGPTFDYTHRLLDLSLADD